MLELDLRRTFRGRGAEFRLAARLNLPGNFRQVVFFGPSGSGKTICLQCLAGIRKPTTGRIIFDRRVFYDSAKKIWLPAQKRHVGYMPQEYALFPHLNLLQNVAYPHTGLFARHCGQKEKAAAQVYIDALGLQGLESHLPSQLSGGQKQRAALARALNSQPGLLLLDEPFSALDPLLRVRTREEIGLFLKKLAIPAVIVTHDPEDVDAFAGYLALFDQGRVTLVSDYQAERKKYDNAARCLLSLQERHGFECITRMASVARL